MLGFGKPNFAKLRASHDIKKLSKLLSSKDAKTRLQAIIILGELEDPSAISPLIPLTEDISAPVREKAIEVLSKLGWKSSESNDSGNGDGEKLDADDDESAVARNLMDDLLSAPETNDEPEIEHSTDVVISEQILNLIEKKKDLPPLPDVVAKINEKMKDQDSSLREISKLIAADPALTAHIISVANSAYYSAGRVSIKDLSMAIGRLGLKEIRNIILSFSVINQFKDSRLLDQKQFWRHSLAVGFCSHSLSKIMKLDLETQDLTYISGLMHDVGLMVFGYLAPDSYHNFLRKIVGDHTNDPSFFLPKYEDQAFHADHASVGAAYIDFWWPVDKQVVHAVQHHHFHVGAANLPVVSKIVIIANDFCNSRGLNNGVNVKKEPEDFSRNKYIMLGLNEDQIEKFEETAAKGIEAADLILSL